MNSKLNRGLAGLTMMGCALTSAAAGLQLPARRMGDLGGSGHPRCPELVLQREKHGRLS